MGLGHVDPNRLGIVSAVMLTGWHAIWLALVATGQAQRVADFVLRMHSMKSEVVVGPFDPGLAALLLAATAVLGYAGGAVAAALWNWLGAAAIAGRAGGKAGVSARV